MQKPLHVCQGLRAQYSHPHHVPGSPHPAGAFSIKSALIDLATGARKDRKYPEVLALWDLGFETEETASESGWRTEYRRGVS